MKDNLKIIKEMAGEKQKIIKDNFDKINLMDGVNLHQMIHIIKDILQEEFTMDLAYI